MPFTFTGDSTLTYVQYMDVEADRTLIAVPGVSYDMAPAGNWDLPVPPADGKWAAGESDPPDKPAAPSPPASVPPPLMTAASTEDEGK